MNEFKFHVNRSFGTEQFTFSATVKSDNLTLTDEEIKKSLTSMSQAIDTQFGEVLDREIKEKIQSSQRLQDRVNANQQIREAITKVNLAEILTKYTPDQVEEAFNKLASEVNDSTTADPKDVTPVVESPYSPDANPTN